MDAVAGGGGLRPSTIDLPDGRCLGIYSAGPAPRPGGDLVVLEAGLGAVGATWAFVMDLLAQQGVSSIAYDRAGYGISTPHPEVRSITALADDLEHLLDILVREHNPERLVLVAHSWGGLVVRTVASRLLQYEARPGALAAGAASGARPADGPDWRRIGAGIVLVDPSDENVELFFSRAVYIADRIHATLAPPAVRYGAMRLLCRWMYRSLPRQSRDLALDAVCGPHAGHAVAGELEHVFTSLLRMREENPDIGSTPLVIISAQGPGRFVQGAQAVMLRAQETTAAAAQNGRVLQARNSGHQVMLTEPGLVTREILAMLPRA